MGRLAMPLDPGCGATTTHIWTTSPASILPLALKSIVKNGQMWDWWDWVPWIFCFLRDVGNVVHLLHMSDDTLSNLLWDFIMALL
jgi:hypothetical protein